jgi:hypothetical protein
MNEDTLILYYYNDGLTEDERRDIAAALEADSALAAQYDQLCAEMDSLADTDVPAVPAHTVERWHDVIREAPGANAAAPRVESRAFNPTSFAWGAAVAATLVLAVMLVQQPVQPPVELPAPASSAFERGIQVHFRDTQDQLASLSAGSASERMSLVMQIINQNRLFEKAAEQNNADDLARVLRAFEPVLVRLAAEDLSDADAEALRAKLAFELNVMLTKLSRDASNETDTVQTGIQT